MFTLRIIIRTTNQYECTGHYRKARVNIGSLTMYKRIAIYPFSIQLHVYLFYLKRLILQRVLLRSVIISTSILEKETIMRKK